MKKFRINSFWVCFSLLSVVFLSAVLFKGAGYDKYVLEYYYPMMSARVQAVQDDSWGEWKDVSVCSDSQDPMLSDTFSYGTPLVKHQLVCSANTSASDDIEIRVLDSDSKIIVDPVAMKSNTNISLDLLENGIDYILQYRYGNGDYFFNIV